MAWWDKLVKALAAIGGAIAGAFGGLDTMMLVLVAFMVIDYVTGMLVAWMGKSRKTETGHMDSKVGFVGLCKKCLMLIFVLMAALLDRAMGTDAAIFRSMVVWFYMANEGLSVLENLALAGVPFPRRVRQALEQIRDRNDDEPPDEENQKE
ncbi:MAG: holin family protein [Aristaeellaceae bacterium]